MRKIRRLVQCLVAGTVVAFPISVVLTADAESVPQVIQVLKVNGKARYSSDNTTWHSLKKGDVIQPAALIQTAEKSTVDLQLCEQGAAQTSIDAPNGSIRTPDELRANTIRLFENSVLDISKVTVDRTNSGEVLETQLDLRSGRIMGGVRKSSTASKYEIKFLKGVAGVRDGVYLMNSSGELDVLYGTAIVVSEGADGSTPVKVVGANHQFDPGTGEVTEIRSPLPVEPMATTRKPAAAPAASPNPPQQGPGFGGALRKF
jgi:hypothetical protein